MAEKLPNTEVNLLSIERYWFLTWTTYGSWLPGDKRGFTAPEHNSPDTPTALPNPALQSFAKQQMKGPVVFLSRLHATILFEQFQETARYRNWLLCAVAIMPTHIHMIIGVPNDPEPSKLLADFKSYGSRTLNSRFGRPQSGTWWTESGSKRRLPDAHSVEATVNYLRNQPNPLLIWTRDDGIESPSKKPAD